MDPLPDRFRSYPPDPPEHTLAHAAARVIDGLGYRLDRSLRGLRAEDLPFRVAESANRFEEVLDHMQGLVDWLAGALGIESKDAPPAADAKAARLLASIGDIRDRLATMGDDAFRVSKLGKETCWSVFHKPLSDLLHHEGELRIMRHAMGNPPGA